jgi:hypothetical protein
MVKVVMGRKGSGKTKRLIELVTKAAEEENGDVVCIEKDAELTYNIPYKVRLVKLADYKGSGYEFMRGFLSGLRAGNYDITHVFMDSLYKLAGNDSENDAEEFLNWCDAFSDREGVKFTITISADVELASPGIKKYM